MLSWWATVVGVFLFALPTVGFAKAVLLTAMLHILSFLIGTVGVFLGFPALALGTLASVTLREERNQMGGLIPGTIGYTFSMTGTWAIQGGVELFLGYTLLKAFGMTALTSLMIAFFVVYTILQYIDLIIHRMPRNILWPCARLFAYAFVAGLLGLNLEHM